MNENINKIREQLKLVPGLKGYVICATFDNDDPIISYSSISIDECRNAGARIIEDVGRTAERDRMLKQISESSSGNRSGKEKNTSGNDNTAKGLLE